MHWTRQVRRTRTRHLIDFILLFIAGFWHAGPSEGSRSSTRHATSCWRCHPFTQGSDTSSIGKKSDASSMNWCSPQLKMPQLQQTHLGTIGDTKA